MIRSVILLVREPTTPILRSPRPFIRFCIKKERKKSNESSLRFFQSSSGNFRNFNPSDRCLPMIRFAVLYAGRGLRPFDRHPVRPSQCINLTSVSCVFRCMCRRHTSIPKHYFGREFRVVRARTAGRSDRSASRRPFASEKYTYIPANRNDPTCVIASTRKNLLHIHIRRVFARVRGVSFVLAASNEPLFSTISLGQRRSFHERNLVTSNKTLEATDETPRTPELRAVKF